MCKSSVGINQDGEILKDVITAKEIIIIKYIT